MTTSNFMPSVAVEIAFNAGYRTPDADRVWTDVSEWVELEDRIGATRGRQDEQSEIGPSSLSLTLDNTDGRFTAGLASSPYYPNVKLGRPIRVTATPVGGSASVRYTGYVDVWPVEWDGTEARASVKITAASRQARLGLSNQRLSAVEETILADEPDLYYTLGDAEGSTSAADSSGNNQPPLRVVGSGAGVVFGSATGPGTDEITAAQFAGGQWLKGEPLVDANRKAFECFFLRESAPPAAECILTCRDEASSMSIAMNTSGQIEIWDDDSIRLTSASSYADGATHHVAIRSSLPDGDIFLYVDGALVTSDLVTGGFVGLGELGVGGGSPLLAGFAGVIAHVAVYIDTLAIPITAADVAVHAAAGLTGFDGDTSNEWIARLAGWEGVPTAEQTLDAGEAVISGLRTTSATAIDLMATVVTTENGLVYDGKDGSLVFRNRAHRYNQASAFTLDMAAQEVEADYGPLLGRQGLINDSTASSTVETVPPARIVDTASRGEYGTAQDSPELATADEDELTYAASWRVNGYSEPRPRVPTLSVQLVTLDLATQEALLAADIGTRFTVTNCPDNAPAIEVDYVIEGYDEEIGPESWVITFNVSDAAVWTDLFTLDDPDRGLDSGARLAW